ncbi:glutamate--tRNA ligase [Candidatus Poribacteria bacterium]|nr:glutamate--tRNA ligase [Candidatus Poribacteria bacterium]
METNSSVRVRFAPSPTGFLHIGGARTALFNWLFAKHHGGTYILRIDDTDEQRSTQESMQQIYDSLKWLGLDWDEGETVGGDYQPYVQSQRRKIYQKYIQNLLENDNAYYCYCTPEELSQIREHARAENRNQSYNGKCRNLTEKDHRKFEAEGRKPTVRIKVPNQPILVQDLILGETQIAPSSLQDEVIVKSNGAPLYNLTSIADDIEMQVTHVIRGADHLNNTSKQIMIANALSAKIPQFAHLPMVLGSSKGEKLSKRHGATSVDQYRKDGFIPEALINFLVRLGWSLDDKTEILSINDMIDNFSLSRIGKSGSVFDVKRLEWLNNHYILKLNLAKRTSAVIPFLQRDGLLEDNFSNEERPWLEKIVESVGDRLTTLADITTYTKFFFTDDFDYHPKDVKKWLTKGDPVAVLSGARDTLLAIENFDLDTVESKIKDYLNKLEIKRIQVMQPLRLALSGQTFGPDLFTIIILLGQEKTISRINRLIDYIPTINKRSAN